MTWSRDFALRPGSPSPTRTVRLIIAAGHGFHVTHDFGEVLLHAVQHGAFAATTQHLGQIGAARLQHLARKVKAGFDQPHDEQMVGMLVARGMRCHV